MSNQIIQKSGWKNRKYLDWVKTQPCFVCNRQSDEAHHLIGIGCMGGMGMKAPDDLTMPVCRVCHGRLHAEPNLWGDQWEAIAMTLHRAIMEGVFECNL